MMGPAPFAMLALLLASSAHAACVDPFTMLESAEARAEHAGGTAIMVQGPQALRIADAVNHTGEPTDYRGDQLIIWTEGDKASVAFVRDGCGTGEEAIFSVKAFRAVLAKAWPRQKTDWRGM